MHGKNGVGRLTFFKFAQNAHWITTSQSEDRFTTCSIKIANDGLNRYDPQLLEAKLNSQTGTKVTFTNLLVSKTELEKEIIPFLVTEFCWFLELNKNKNYTIFINGDVLDCTQNIIDFEDDIIVKYDKSELIFKCKYVQWKGALHKEFSKYYFLNGDGQEVYKDFTTLNKKGDEFFHSIYIQSEFFDDFDFNSNENEDQVRLFGKAKSSPEYKYLIKEVNKYLREKRKPFLRVFASKMVEKFEQDGVMPVYKNEWENLYKKSQLEETIIGLYEAQPKLFTNLNIEQKKTFVRFLNLLLDSNERESLFKIIDEIIELDQEEREDLAKLFKVTRLNRIIETTKLIEDRYRTYYKLKDLVFNPDLKADEVHHLQKFIESHYWIFGEQYHLVTAAEPKFDEALKRYHYLLYKEDIGKKVEHPDKYKEMDIFACRQNFLNDKIENIVIELKHPDIKIGKNQFNQVDKYLEVILSEPLFNGSNMNWEFYLIGKDFDTSGFIERQLESNANHGISSLIQWYDKGRIKVYAKKWSEVFNEFEINHKYLDEKLKLEREMLVNELESANEIVESVQNNSAIQPKEIVLN
jgi:hypothetical protein